MDMQTKVTVEQNTFFSLVKVGNWHSRSFFGPFHTARAEEWKSRCEYRLGLYDAELAAYREKHAEAYREVERCRRESLH